MSLVNLATRQITTVELFPAAGGAGVRLDAYFNSGNASFSALQLPNGGYSVITGNITLIQTDDQINFDDRYEPIWTRGGRIEITYTSPINGAITSRYPVIGTTYISSTRYDFQSTLSLDINCILALLNKLTPADLGICLNIGSGIQVNRAVKELLLAAGLNSADFDDTSFNQILSEAIIVEPFAVPQGQSIIQTAGTLIGQYGAFMAQDLNGKVKCFKWNDVSNKAKLFSKRARDLHSYQRYGSFDSRVKKLIMTHNNLTVCEEDAVQQQATLQGNQLTETFISRDDINRTISRITNEFRNVSTSPDPILVSRVEEISSYELEPSESVNLIRQGQATTNGACFPEDTGRILTRSTTTYIDNTEYISAWLSAQELAIDPSPESASAGIPGLGFSISGANITGTTFEQWNYVSDVETQYVKEVNVPRAFALPVWGDLKGGIAGRTSITNEVDPNELTPYQRTLITWTKSNNACKGWKQVTQTFEFTKVADPDKIINEIADVTNHPDSNVLYDRQFDLVLTNFEVQYNASTPSPDVFPPTSAIAETEIETIFGDTTGVNDTNQFKFDVESRQFLGRFYEYSQAEIEKTGKMLMDFNNGRILGITMADSPFEILSTDPNPLSCWIDFVPMFRSKILEPYTPSPTAGIYVADTPTITLNVNDTVVGWLGVFLGQATDLEDPLNFDYAIISGVQPSSEIDAVTIPQIAINVTYSENTTSTVPSTIL